MSEWLLEARELHTYYGASHVLHGVDFRIDRGETVGLMGRNGMGKSTLIRSMLGLVKPRDGEVRVRGTPMTGAEPLSRRAPGHRLRAGGPRHLSESHRAREPRDGGARRSRRAPRLDVRARARDLSAARRAARPRRLAAVGRRAADADDRPRADDESRSPDPRRGHRGPRAADREGDLAHRRRHPRARHRHADRRQELPGGHGDRRPQRDPRQGARRVRGRQPARCSRSRTSCTGISGSECRSSRSRRIASSTSASAIARRAAAHARLPARRAGLGRRCGATSPAASRGRPDCGAIVESRYGYGRSDPLAGAANGPVHARRGADRAARIARRARDRAPDPGRAQRRRLDRADPRGRRLRPLAARGHAGGARAGRGPLGREHRRRERRLRNDGPAREARAPSRRRRFGVPGLEPHLARSPEFRAWNIEEYLPRIACPVLAIQGEDDEYGTMEQMRPHRRRGRRRRARAPRRLPPFAAPGPAGRRHRRHRPLRRPRRSPDPDPEADRP